MLLRTLVVFTLALANPAAQLSSGAALDHCVAADLNPGSPAPSPLVPLAELRNHLIVNGLRGVDRRGNVVDLAALEPGSSNLPNSKQVVGQTADFVLFAEGRQSLLRTDGSPEGTWSIEASAGAVQSLVAEAAGQIWGLHCADGICQLWSVGAASHRLEIRREWGRDAGSATFLRTALGALYLGLGRDLWRFDPVTGASGRLLQGEGSNVSSPVALGGRLLLESSAAPRLGLWSVNPIDGTAIVLTPPGLRDLSEAVVSGGRAYFVADEGAAGLELWSSNGTVAGTRRETRFAEAEPFGSGEPQPPIVARLGARALFVGQDRFGNVGLWATTVDQTPQLLHSICSGPCDVGRQFVWASPRRLSFLAQTGIGGGKTFELWSSDGTNSGTRFVKRICAGECTSLSLVSFVGGPLLHLRDSLRDSFWVSDGTARGTRMVLSTHLYFTQVPGDLLMAANGRQLYFGADGGLWRVPLARTAAPRRVAEGPHFAPYSLPWGLTPVSNRLAFANHAPEAASGLWGLATTPESLERLTPPARLPSCGSFGPCQAFHRAAEGLLTTSINAAFGGYNVHRSDGTAAGTVQLFAPSSDETFDGQLSAWGSRQVWATSRRLFLSDGSVAGTRSLSLAGLPGGIKPLGGLEGGPLLLVVVEAASGLSRFYQLSPITDLVTDVAGEGEGVLGHGSFLVVPGTTRLFVISRPRFTSYQVHHYDGVAGILRPLFEFPGPVHDFPAAVTAGDRLFLLFSGLNAEWRLWTIDQQATKLAERAGSDEDRTPYQARGPLVPHLGKVYFSALGDEHGFEIWSTDGTSEGTGRVADIWPGRAGSDPQALASTSRGLLFSADDGRHGREVWEADGSAGGARMVLDLYPGLVSSDPQEFTEVGERLYFVGFDPDHGRELLVTPASGCVR